MRIRFGYLAVWLAAGSAGWAQVPADAQRQVRMEEKLAAENSAAEYVVLGTTPAQQAVLRAQIRAMQPEILPQRIVFVPHWQYVYAAKAFQLHVPRDMSSVMFTHLASRTVYIDNDRYLGEEWLGYWIAHELGHLVTNSAKEEDAERIAREFRKRLKDPRNKNLLRSDVPING